MTVREFLESKIGKYSPSHPFLEKEVDYADIENWLIEFAKQKSICRHCGSDYTRKIETLIHCDNCDKNTIFYHNELAANLREIL
jgi:Zn finger protein HypA/HybF involved in hydrogenase expression